MEKPTKTWFHWPPTDQKGVSKSNIPSWHIWKCFFPGHFFQGSFHKKGGIAWLRFPSRPSGFSNSCHPKHLCSQSHQTSGRWSLGYSCGNFRWPKILTKKNLHSQENLHKFWRWSFFSIAPKQNHCIIWMDLSSSFWDPCAPVIQLVWGVWRTQASKVKCKITVHTAVKIKWIQYVHYIYIYTHPFFHNHGSVENNPKWWETIILEISPHFPLNPWLWEERYINMKCQISSINTLEFGCGKAAGCHSLHHPSWPQPNPQLKDLVLVSLGLLLGRFPIWDPFHIGLRYWRKSNVTIYSTSIYHHASTKVDAYIIYIYCICIHVSICTYSYLPVSYICIHISIYTRMLIFLHFPHCQWQWKRPKVFFEQDGTQKDACKSELFHYDPNQPQKLHPHHRLLSPSVSPFILHLLSKGFVDGCQPGKRPHVFSTTDWYTTTDLWVLGMYYFFHLIHFGENCIHTPIYYVLNINIYIYEYTLNVFPVPPTVTTH